MGHSFIDQDNARELPGELSDEFCREFFNHCRDLGHHGNPGGYIVTVELFPFIGYEFASQIDGAPVRRMKPYQDWDYDGIRTWIQNNQELALISWQRYIRRVW